MTKGYLRSIKSLLTSAALALSLAACAGHLGPVGSANGKGVFPVPSPDQACTDPALIAKLPQAEKVFPGATAMTEVICKDPALLALKRQNHTTAAQLWQYLTPAEGTEFANRMVGRLRDVVARCGTDRNCLYQDSQDFGQKLALTLGKAQQRSQQAAVAQAQPRLCLRIGQPTPFSRAVEDITGCTPPPPRQMQCSTIGGITDCDWW